MVTFEAYLEADEDAEEEGATIWVPQLPGFFVRGRSAHEATERLPSSVSRFIEWLGKLGTEILGGDWDGRVAIQEVYFGTGSFFRWDVQGCTSKDVEAYLKVMTHSRKELEEFVSRMPKECEDWIPVTFAPRSPKLIALHIAATEIWYLNQFFNQSRVTEGLASESSFKGTGVFEFGPQAWHYNLGGWYRSFPIQEFLRATRRVFEDVVRSATDYERRRVVSANAHLSQEQWTLRKVLRRAAWHERLHMVTMKRYVDQFRLEERAKASPPAASADRMKVEALISGEGERIQLTASSVHPDERPIYGRELVKLIGSLSESFEVRRSAADALNFVGDPRINVLAPDMVLISAGSFLMGTSETNIAELASTSKLPEAAFSTELPQREVYLPNYEIGRHLITNLEYLQFVKETGRKYPRWWSGTVVGPSFLPWKANHPVWGINWDDTKAYCEWLSSKTGRKYRLATEAEWEKAARGNDGRQYPWGGRFELNRCNTREAGFGGTTPVGLFAEGASPYGVMDMCGNIEEWTSDIYRHNVGGPPLSDRLRFVEGSDEFRITKSGGWRDAWISARCAFRRLRQKGFDRESGGRIGFRLVREPG